MGTMDMTPYNILSENLLNQIIRVLTLEQKKNSLEKKIIISETFWVVPNDTITKCCFSGKKRRLITIHDDVLATQGFMFSQNTKSETQSPGFHEHFDFSGRATHFTSTSLYIYPMCDN